MLGFSAVTLLLESKILLEWWNLIDFYVFGHDISVWCWIQVTISYKKFLACIVLTLNRNPHVCNGNWYPDSLPLGFIVSICIQSLHEILLPLYRNGSAIFTTTEKFEWRHQILYEARQICNRDTRNASSRYGWVFSKGSTAFWIPCHSLSKVGRVSAEDDECRELLISKTLENAGKLMNSYLRTFIEQYISTFMNHLRRS